MSNLKDHLYEQGNCYASQQRQALFDQEFEYELDYHKEQQIMGHLSEVNSNPSNNKELDYSKCLKYQQDIHKASLDPSLTSLPRYSSILILNEPQKQSPQKTVENEYHVDDEQEKQTKKQRGGLLNTEPKEIKPTQSNTETQQLGYYSPTYETISQTESTMSTEATQASHLSSPLYVIPTQQSSSPFGEPTNITKQQLNQMDQLHFKYSELMSLAFSKTPQMPIKLDYFHDITLQHQKKSQPTQVFQDNIKWKDGQQKIAEECFKLALEIANQLIKEESYTLDQFRRMIHQSNINQQEFKSLWRSLVDSIEDEKIQKQFSKEIINITDEVVKQADRLISIKENEMKKKLLVKDYCYQGLQPRHAANSSKKDGEGKSKGKATHRTYQSGPKQYIESFLRKEIKECPSKWESLFNKVFAKGDDDKIDQQMISMKFISLVKAKLTSKETLERIFDSFMKSKRGGSEQLKAAKWKKLMEECGQIV